MKELPDVVMDTLLEIKVFNVKMLMKDALIGSFKVRVYVCMYVCMYVRMYRLEHTALVL